MIDKNDEKYDENGWFSWKRYVVKSIENLTKRQEEIEKEINKNKLDNTTDITVLQQKVKLSSAIISSVISAIVAIIIGVSIAIFSQIYVDDKFINDYTKTIIIEIIKQLEYYKND